MLLKFSFLDALCSVVPLGYVYMCLDCNCLHLAILWLVFANLRWIRSACVTNGPFFATRGAEARCFPDLLVAHDYFVVRAEFLIKRNEEAGSRSTHVTNALPLSMLAFTLPPAAILGISDLVHFLRKIIFLFIAKK